MVTAMVGATMHVTKLLRCGFAAASLLTLASAALADDAGPYAPENIEKTDKAFGWACMIQATCPVSTNVRNLIQRAIKHDRSAEYLLGLNLLVGTDMPMDRRSGTLWVVRAAEQGEPSAARMIAGRMRNGEAIDIDETKVANALKPQAAAGDADSMRALAPMLMRGRGAAQDPPAGLAMLKRAAATGSTEAEKDLFQLYLNGAPDVPPDRPEAMRWLAISARHGNADAMYSLGYMSMTMPIGARNTGKDVAEGYCWIVRAALLNDKAAQEKLSSVLSDGEKDDRGNVIPVDLIQADVWFRLAAQSPYHNNSQIRSGIEPKMTTAQLEEAKRQAAAWQPKKYEDLKTLAIALPGTSPPRNCMPF